MEPTHTAASEEAASLELEELNALSEQLIKKDYQAAELKGPHWVLALLDKAK